MFCIWRCLSTICNHYGSISKNLRMHMQLKACKTVLIHTTCHKFLKWKVIKCSISTFAFLWVSGCLSWKQLSMSCLCDSLFLLCCLLACPDVYSVVDNFWFLKLMLCVCLCWSNLVTSIFSITVSDLPQALEGISSPSPLHYPRIIWFLHWGISWNPF